MEWGMSSEKKKRGKNFQSLDISGNNLNKTKSIYMKYLMFVLMEGRISKVKQNNTLKLR